MHLTLTLEWHTVLSHQPTYATMTSLESISVDSFRFSCLFKPTKVDLLVHPVARRMLGTPSALSPVYPFSESSI
jgi:hypothetical protein